MQIRHFSLSHVQGNNNTEEYPWMAVFLHWNRFHNVVVLYISNCSLICAWKSLTHSKTISFQVGRIQELFPNLSEHEEHVLDQQTSVKKQIEIIVHVNNILIVSQFCHLSVFLSYYSQFHKAQMYFYSKAVIPRSCRSHTDSSRSRLSVTFSMH